MAFTLNEYDVAFAVEVIAKRDDLPNLRKAAVILARLVEWTNANSDGWPYWRKPVAASKQLQQLVEPIVQHKPVEEVTDRQLMQALGHVKAFLTRQEVSDADRALILEGVRA